MSPQAGPPIRTPLIAGNWKMNGSLAEGQALARAIVADANGLRCELLVCPPFPLLHPLAAVLAGTPVRLGAQDCHDAAKGAHTGDVSAAMLVDAGCAYVIVGHSERRNDHGETDALVRRKAEAAQAAGLAAVVCIGETAAQREGGETMAVLASQIDGSVSPQAAADRLVIAYEPVWAIGSGQTPTRDEIQAAHAHIRDRLASRIGVDAARVRLLYGGSVNPGNAADILSLGDVDGALVGGASLKADSFVDIARSTP